MISGSIVGLTVSRRVTYEMYYAVNVFSRFHVIMSRFILCPGDWKTSCYFCLKRFILLSNL